MATLSITLPDELERRMNEFDLDWNDVARRALIEKVEKLKMLKVFSSKFQLSEKEAEDLADKINEAVSYRFLKENGIGN